MQQVIIAAGFGKRPELIRPSLGIAPREWILPTILNSRIDLQSVERFAWPIVHGVQRWCQLFSEPGAGSDLWRRYATRATKVNGGWLVTGTRLLDVVGRRGYR